METQGFIVRVGSTEAYICAPAGYAWQPQTQGGVYRDGTNPHKSSPEVYNRSRAYVFATHRAAARQGNKFARCKIIAV